MAAAARCTASRPYFDCYHRGWVSALRIDDKGHLWEHFVLNEVPA